MVAFYNAADQELYKKYQYLPQEKYRLGLNLPTDTPVAPPPISGGITNTNAFAGGGGDGFSVYNADPNTITNMNPNSYALQDARRKNELSYVGKSFPGNIDPLYSTNTEAMKNMEMYPEYYGLDRPPPSKISQLISKGIGFIPGIGTLSRLADFASGMLPVGTHGVMVNDIGQIVVGPGGQYNTPEGIRAGYNVSKMDDETFTGRQKNIGETLKDKYGLTQTQVDGLISGELTEEDFTDSKYNLKGTNKQTNLITNLINIEKARKNFNNTTGTTDQIVYIKTDTKANNNNNNNNKDGGSGTPPGFGITSQGNYVNQFDGGDPGQGEGQNDGPGDTTDASGTEGEEQDRFRKDGGLMYAKGGRAGYFYGGRVSVMKGGLASIL